MVIVLSILKIIGMILLIVGIAAACVLLIPLQYEGSGEIDRKIFRFRLSWLFRVIQFRFQSKGDISSYDIYLFGIRTGFLDPDRMERRKKKKAKRKSKRRQKKYRKARKRYLKEKEKKQEQISLDADSKSEAEKQEQTEAEKVSGNRCEDRNGTDAFKDKAKDRDGTDSSATKTKDTGSGQVSALWQKIKKVCGVLKAARQAGLLHLLLPLKTLFYHMRPRNMKGDIRFGFEDPSLTGKAVGALSCVFVLYQYEELYVTPDFETEESFLSGSIRGKGHIRMIHMLLCGIRIFKQKEFRRFLKSLKQI